MVQENDYASASSNVAPRLSRSELPEVTVKNADFWDTSQT